MVIDHPTAKLYASWFGCLADPNRLRILNLLSSSRKGMLIRELVEALEIGQPTVSHHVQQLELARFVSCERDGASTVVRVNRRCLRAFPSAAAVVMGTVEPVERPWDKCAT